MEEACFGWNFHLLSFPLSCFLWWKSQFLWGGQGWRMASQEPSQLLPSCPFSYGYWFKRCPLAPPLHLWQTQWIHVASLVVFMPRRLPTSNQALGTLGGCMPKAGDIPVRQCPKKQSAPINKGWWVNTPLLDPWSNCPASASGSERIPTGLSWSCPQTLAHSLSAFLPLWPLTPTSS